MTVQTIFADVQTLEPGEEVWLFALDGSAFGADQLYFHGYTQVGPIYWQGIEYSPWPIQVEGFALDPSKPPTPTLSAGNVGGRMTALCLAFQDLVGAKLLRHRTLGKYLDAANFPGGNPTADPTQEFPVDTWKIQRRASETAEMVQWELSSGLNFNNRQAPCRQIGGLCSWLLVGGPNGGYRGTYCGYNGPPVAKADDTPTNDPAQDACSGWLSGCRLRFGQDGELPHGGFPAAQLIK